MRPTSRQNPRGAWLNSAVTFDEPSEEFYVFHDAISLMDQSTMDDSFVAVDRYGS